MNNMIRTGRRTTSAQFEIMLDFFELYPQLIGKNDANFTKEMRDKRWEDLTAVLNTVGDGAIKSIAGWKKTLKDWKCYVKKKASRIALQEMQPDDPYLKDELSILEVKLLKALGKLEDLGLSSVLESSICEDTEPEVSINPVITDVMGSIDVNNYYLKRKAAKRKAKKSLTSSKRTISFQNESNEVQQQMPEVADRKVALLEQQVAILKRRAVAEERKAKAKEQLVLLEKSRIHQQWRNEMHGLRMEKLKYL